ncbi:MAG: TIGR04282 family arsenosugar biosynthesis glycosyltransferase [Solirubrobacterales bacterium]|nr:TIGR04282 family arsenosugar biosynthesis glycosyltransferase [Solirubrobacterales bacterium]
MLPRLLVIAKAPVPGRSKTRLCPPCSAEQAAALAEAALADTLDTVSRTDCGGRTIVLDGEPGDWLPQGFELVGQAGGGLGDRLAAAFSGCPGPALLIGMDTPQVSPELLADGLGRLARPGTDAVLGPCEDGGYWAIGLSRPQPGAFDGVPMSTGRTGEVQLGRLRELGLEVDLLDTLCDVDHFADAARVAAERPGGRFAEALRMMEPSFA